MSAGYGETLRRRQFEGLCAAEEQRLWRAGRPAVRESAEPDGPAREAAGPQEPQKDKRAPASWSDKDVVACKGCWYWRTLDYTMGIKACWYPLLEDKLRPCRPADCYRRSGTPYRPMAQRRKARGGRRRKSAEAAGEKAKGGGTPGPQRNAGNGSNEEGSV